MKTINIILFSALLLITTSATTSKKPRKYQKNRHVTYRVDQSRDTYQIDYSFRDHFGGIWDVEISFDREMTDDLIGDFGIPAAMFKPYHLTPAVLQHRERVLQEGLFMVDGNKLRPDYRALVKHYRNYVSPIADVIVEALRQTGQDTRHNRIEMAMKFVQDIPYAIPNNDTRRMYYGGMSPPPETLINGYGDCDSKAILFACILSHLIDQDDVILLHQPGHMLTAIRGERFPGASHLSYQGDTFVLAETAGPGHANWGEVDSTERSATIIDIS